MASSRARSTGPRPTSAGWLAIATSSMRRCCTAAPRSFTKASPWARPTPAHFGASSPSMAALPYSRRRRPSAPSRRRIRRASCWRDTIAGNPVGLGQLPVKYGSASVAMPGYQVDIVDDTCKPVQANKIGSIVLKLPLPPGCLPTLWQQDERFKESYLAEFPGYYKTADAGFKDEDGYIHVMSRTDDIINVAGH